MEWYAAPLGSIKCGHPFSRHGSKASTQDQTRGVSYYMEGVHEQVVRPASQLVLVTSVVLLISMLGCGMYRTGGQVDVQCVDLDWFSSATSSRPFFTYIGGLNVGPASLV